MSRLRAIRGSRFLFASVWLLPCIGDSAFAKDPTLTGLFPAGAARGEKVTVKASGSFDHWPVTAWIDHPGIAIESAPEKGNLVIQADADAEPGVYWLRLHNEDGATALRPFVVGTLPELAEVEPNDDPARPQAISTASISINGRLAKSGDVDGFSVTLERGQTLVADLEANRNLGSPMDGVLQVVSPGGFVLAQNDDTTGRDPRIVYMAPTSGTYTVRVFAFPASPDSTIRFAGGENYIYRLTLTTGGFVDHAFPLAMNRDGKPAVEAMGWNIPAEFRTLTMPSHDDDRDNVRLAHPMLAGSAEVRIVAGLALAERDSKDHSNLQEIPEQGAISGRIETPNDRDVYRVTLKKGEKRLIRVESRGLGLPLDPVLRIVDISGKILAEADDTRCLDPELVFTAPADGEYRVSVHDLNGRGGPRFAYVLTMQRPSPDFSLAIPSDRVEITPGKPTSVVVTIERKDGFAGVIELVGDGLPSGVTLAPMTSRPGDASAKSVTLEIRAEPGARSGPFRIVGKTKEGSARPRQAFAPIPGFEAKTDHPWILIRPAADSTKK